MTGKSLVKRIGVTLALATGFLMYLAVMNAEAAPIRPDIRKILEQAPADSTARLVPARAGWDGPEMALPQRLAVDVSLEAMGVGPARADRAALMAVATPDPRAIIGIVAVIFLLRLLRRQGAATQLAPVTPAEGEERLAA